MVATKVSFLWVVPEPSKSFLREPEASGLNPPTLRGAPKKLVTEADKELSLEVLVLALLRASAFSTIRTVTTSPTCLALRSEYRSPSLLPGLQRLPSAAGCSGTLAEGGMAFQAGGGGRAGLHPHARMIANPKPTPPSHFPRIPPSCGHLRIPP